MSDTIQALNRELLNMEEMRKNAWRSVFYTFLVVTVIVAGVEVWLYFNSQELNAKILSGAGGFLVWVIFSFHKQSQFVSQYKSTIMPLLLSKIAPGLEYSAKDGINKDEFCASGLYMKPDRYKGKDLVCGVVDKTHIRFSLVHAEEKYETTSTDSDGKTTRQTHYRDIFKGMFFSADFNKHFNGQTLVKAGSAGLLTRMFGRQVQLEDPEFAQKFTVYGTDQIEARYILSPALMQRLLELQARVSERMNLSFTGSRVMLDIQCNYGLFEPRFFRKSNNSKVINDYTATFRTMIGLVEDLNLNRRIWTKQ